MELNLDDVGTFRDHISQLLDHFQEAAVLIEETHIPRPEMIELKRNCEGLASVLSRLLLSEVGPAQQRFLRQQINNVPAVKGLYKTVPVSQADGFAE